MIKSFAHLNLTVSSLLCLLMSLIYVLSLYLWSPQNRYDRNAPAVIKRRFVSVILTCVSCTALLYALSGTGTNETFWHLIGFNFRPVLLAKSLVPLALTMILFLGPLVQLGVNNQREILLEFDNLKELNLQKTLASAKNYMVNLVGSIIWWRNYVISPFTEEFVFRSCMICMLVSKMDAQLIYLLTPLYFGLAHVHHAFEEIQKNREYLCKKFYLKLLAANLFQFSYTYVFGVYSSYLFLRTSLFLPTFLAHSFCNTMGFPNVHQFIYGFKNKLTLQITIAGFYLLGLVLFICLLKPLTEPAFYENLLFKN